MTRAFTHHFAITLDSLFMITILKFLCISLNTPSLVYQKDKHILSEPLNGGNAQVDPPVYSFNAPPTHPTSPLSTHRNCPGNNLIHYTKQ